jgi:hypothetical protein
MSPNKEGIVTFRISPEVQAGMETLRERYGTPFSEQCRRALESWLREQGMLTTKPEGRRAATGPASAVGPGWLARRAASSLSSIAHSTTILRGSLPASLKL